MRGIIAGKLMRRIPKLLNNYHKSVLDEQNNASWTNMRYTILANILLLYRYYFTHFLHQKTITSQNIRKYSVLLFVDAYVYPQLHWFKDCILLNKSEMTLVELRNTTASKSFYAVSGFVTLLNINKFLKRLFTAVLAPPQKLVIY